MIGEKIKQLRKENDITQEELAKNIGVSTSMVGMYETNSRKPSYDVLVKISKYFKVSTDYLLGKIQYKTYGEKFEEEYTDNQNNQLKEELALYETGEFNTPEGAMQFILKQPSIMGFGGFNIEKMSNEEIVEFANELLRQLKLISYKYKK